MHLGELYVNYDFQPSVIKLTDFEALYNMYVNIKKI